VLLIIIACAKEVCVLLADLIKFIIIIIIVIIIVIINLELNAFFVESDVSN